MDKELISQLKNLKNIQPKKDWVSSNKDTLLSQIDSQVSDNFNNDTIGEMLKTLVFQPRLIRSAVRVFTVFLLILGVSLSGGIASVSASRSSVPGDFFYPIKITIEKAQVGLSSKKEDKAKLELEFAGRRIEEVEKITETGEVEENKKKDEKVEKALSKFKDNLNTAKNHLGDIKDEGKSREAVKLAVAIDDKTEEFSKLLKKQKEVVPKAALAVEEAIDVTEETSEKAIDVIIEEHGKGELAISQKEVAEKVEEKISKAEDQLNEAEEIVNKAEDTEEEITTDGDTEEEITTDGDTEEEITTDGDTEEDLENIEEKPEAAKLILEEARQLLEEGDFASAFLKVKEGNAITKDVIQVVEASSITDAEDAETVILEEVVENENQDDEVEGENIEEQTDDTSEVDSAEENSNEEN